jgi:mRNA interferase YafQ
MRTIQQTSQYKRDLKRSQNSGNHPAQELRNVLELLATDQPLPEKNKDHALSQNWKDHRECHIKPDLLLVYKLPDEETLRLFRLGSHSEIFR